MDGGGSRFGSIGHLNLGNEQVLLKRRGLGDDAAIGIEHQRSAVEHQFVLTSHQIDIDDGAPGFGDPLAEHIQPLVQFADVIGRGIQVEDDLCSGRGHLAHRAARHPGVLTDGDAKGHSGYVVQNRFARAGLEVAALVEHPVIGQFPLVVHPRQPAMGPDPRGVPAAFDIVHKPHHRSARS